MMGIQLPCKVSVATASCRARTSLDKKVVEVVIVNAEYPKVPPPLAVVTNVRVPKTVPVFVAEVLCARYQIVST
jgi:hypothetical protein